MFDFVRGRKPTTYGLAYVFFIFSVYTFMAYMTTERCRTEVVDPTIIIGKNFVQGMKMRLVWEPPYWTFVTMETILPVMLVATILALVILPICVYFEYFRTPPRSRR